MHVQIVVSLIIPIAFLLVLPIVVIQKFCCHGNVTSHFSSLFEIAWHLKIKLFPAKNSECVTLQSI